MFHFLHGYSPKLWAGYVKNGLISPGDGIRFVQNIFTPDEYTFNTVAAKGGELWKLVTEENRPLYIDRLQGGCHYYEYPFDQQLLEEYRRLLGDKFLGFQMHEWMSNYRSDLNKCAEVSAENWDEEHICEAIYKFSPPPLFLESMGLDEFIAGGKVETAEQFYNNMTAHYKMQLEKYKDFVAVDSGYIMYPFEIELGVNLIMPEIGAQGYRDIILLMSFSRAVTGANGVKFGAYYEPWGGDPFSCCVYNPENNNEWFLSTEGAFPYKTGGENGGSSRSNQKRIYLYAYLSGAEYMSEEWGAYNTFCDKECTKLSEYGLVKKSFIDFTRKYPDIGEKMAPIAVVLPADLPTYVVQREGESHTGDPLGHMYQCPLGDEKGKRWDHIRDTMDSIFRNTYPMIGNECRGLCNSRLPDAVDVLTEKEESALEKYAYIVDLTGNPDFAARHDNIIPADKVAEKLGKLLPVKVEGECHYMVNRLPDGEFYLTIFNHNGIVRTVADGEYGLPEAATTLRITLAPDFADRTLQQLEGEGKTEQKDGAYTVTLQAGEYIFMKF